MGVELFHLKFQNSISQNWLNRMHLAYLTGMLLQTILLGQYIQYTDFKWSSKFICRWLQIPTLYLFVGSKAKGQVSKRVFQENKARQILRKTNISYPLIRTRKQEMIQAVFDISIPSLGTLISACPNLILSKTETTIKPNSSFFDQISNIMWT